MADNISYSQINRLTGAYVTEIKISVDMQPCLKQSGYEDRIQD